MAAAGLFLLTWLLTATSLTAAEVPRMIDYQGRIAVGGTHFLEVCQLGQGSATNSGVVGVDNFLLGWLKPWPDFCDVRHLH